MTDDDESHKDATFMTLEEFQQQYAQSIDRRIMNEQATRHEVVSFIMSMTADQLRTFHLIMAGITRSDDPVEMTSFYEGVCLGVLHMGHNVCAACGQNHDAEIANLAATADTGDTE